MQVGNGKTRKRYRAPSSRDMRSTGGHLTYMGGRVRCEPPDHCSVFDSVRVRLVPTLLGPGRRKKSLQQESNLIYERAFNFCSTRFELRNVKFCHTPFFSRPCLFQTALHSGLTINTGDHALTQYARQIRLRSYVH